MRRLLVVRHAPARWPEEPEEARYHGWRDAPLGEQGLLEARALAEEISRRYPDLAAVYSSDLSRASGTADEIAAAAGLANSRREDLREIHFGEWEGNTHAELLEKDPKRYRRWLEDPRALSPPGGETLGECRERVMAEFRRIGRESAGETAALVGHGGSLRLLLCGLLGMPPENHWRLRLDFCGVSVVDFVNETPVLVLLNDRSRSGGPP